jgi:hypothetical protein
MHASIHPYAEKSFCKKNPASNVTLRPNVRQVLLQQRLATSSRGGLDPTFAIADTQEEEEEEEEEEDKREERRKKKGTSDVDPSV